MEDLGDHRCWSSLVLTIQLLGYLILIHTHIYLYLWWIISTLLISSMVYKPTNTTGGRASMAMVPGPPGQPGGPMFGGHQALFWGMNGQEHTQIYIYDLIIQLYTMYMYMYMCIYIYIYI